MRYEEFADLCEREFADNGGDVTALHLTHSSAAELTDGLSSGPFRKYRIVVYPPGRQAFAQVAPADIGGVETTAVQAINPVTLSLVSIDSDSDRDWATVTRVASIASRADATARDGAD